jgi:hypothetical protein
MPTKAKYLGRLLKNKTWKILRMYKNKNHSGAHI